MSLDTLSDQLRAVVDAVDTPTFAEIRAHTTPPRTRSPRTRVAVALAAVLLVVVIGVGLAALLRDDTADHAQTTPAAIPAECMDRNGCAMSATDASRILGFEVREPAGLPDGWVSLGARLRVFEDVPLYVRAWGPPGTDLSAPEVCAPHVVTRERPAFSGEDPSRSGTPYPLGNGTTAYGEAPDVGCYHGSLGWVRDGRSFVVEGTNMTPGQLTDIARSIDGRSDTVPAKCVITLSNYAGCEMTAKRAQQYLSFKPRVPQHIPEGWVQQPSRLKVPSPGEAEFVQTWAPPGSPPVATRPVSLTCSPFLMVRQRLARVGDGQVRTDIGTVDLGNGRVVTETLEPEPCGANGAVDSSGTVFWADRGRYVSITARGIQDDEFLAIAQSLDR
ncbi:MAG: hypothetical protein U0W40_18020 [Acidimicrobiia bacterium]